MQDQLGALPRARRSAVCTRREGCVARSDAPPPPVRRATSESRSREGVWWGGARSSSGARDTVRCAASLAQLMAVTSVAGGGPEAVSAPLGARGVLTPVPDRHHPHQAPREVWAQHAVTRHPCHPNGTCRQRSAATVWLCRHESCVPGFLRHTILPFPLSCSYGCLSLGELSYDAAPLVPEHCLPFPSRASRGRFAQSGKDPRALLVPSYTTATTAKTAPVGLCGPV